EYTDGTIDFFEEKQLVTTDSNITKCANKLTSTDTLKGKPIYIATKVAKDGQTAVCNLASINLSKINTEEDIKRVVPIMVRLLD
ncbi:ribonucleoside-diphosphate reductase subunit alpha, partial [Staphylococcus pseudintermedius]